MSWLDSLPVYRSFALLCCSCFHLARSSIHHSIQHCLLFACIFLHLNFFLSPIGLPFVFSYISRTHQIWLLLFTVHSAHRFPFLSHSTTFCQWHNSNTQTNIFLCHSPPFYSHPSNYVHKRSSHIYNVLLEKRVAARPRRQDHCPPNRYTTIFPLKP